MTHTGALATFERLIARASLAICLLGGCHPVVATSGVPEERLRVARPQDLSTTGLEGRVDTMITYSRGAADTATEHESVRAIVERRFVPLADGGAGVLVVTSGHYAGGDYVDSLLMRRDGLAPVREYLAYLQRKTSKLIEYSDAMIRQTNRAGDSVRSFRVTYPVPVFAFSEIDLVIPSLPLAPGYQTVLPLYSEGDDSLEVDTLTVTGREGGQWTARFADPAVVATYRIDSLSRRILSYDVVSRRTGGRARKTGWGSPPADLSPAPIGREPWRGRP